MKRFKPRGRPSKLKNPQSVPMYLEAEMLEQIDKYNLDHEIPSRAELIRQLFQHVLHEEQEDKHQEQQEQQEKDKSVSCLAHKLGEVTTVEEEVPEIDIIDRTPLELLMEEAVKLLTQVDKIFDGLPTDIITKKKFKGMITVILNHIRQETQKEYDRKSGLNQLKKDALLKKMQPLGSRL